MKYVVLLSSLMGVALVCGGAVWAATPVGGVLVRQQVEPEIQPEAPKDAPLTGDERREGRAIEEPTHVEKCEALAKYEAEEAKKKSEAEEPAAPSTPEDGSPKVTLISSGPDSTAAPDAIDAAETGDKDVFDVAGLSDEDREALKKDCETKVELAPPVAVEGTGTGAPAVSAAPTSAPASGGYTVPAGGNVAMPGTSPVTGSGFGDMFQQILQQQIQQQAQQQLMQQLSGQGGGAGGSNGCPTGTTLTLVNGLNACVGTTQTTSASCVQLNGKNYCRENDCSSTDREKIRINGVDYCTAVTSSTTTRDGYEDGSAMQNGVCGMQIPEEYTANQEYLAAYARGVNDCRAAEVTETTSGTTPINPVNPITPVSATVGGIDDATVRVECAEQINAMASALREQGNNIPNCLMDMVFQRQVDLGDPNQCIEGQGTTEADVYGFDETRQNRLVTAKTQFDAGKIDALNGAATNINLSTMPEAYRQGVLCGQNL